MWFITLVKLRKAPNPQEAEAMNKMMREAAAKMGVKIHQGFMTLGRYDAVWITETLVGTSYEEAMKWMH